MKRRKRRSCEGSSLVHSSQVVMAVQKKNSLYKEEGNSLISLGLIELYMIEGLK